MTKITEVGFREAGRGDLDAMVALLADDPLGQTRETAAHDDVARNAYTRAFEAIMDDARNRLIVAETGGQISGCLQLTFIPGLTYTGGERAQIEGVRIRKDLRGGGLGKGMIGHAIDLARARGCTLVQLTTDKRRPEAIAFYGSLGFTASHDGLKLAL